MADLSFRAGVSTPSILPQHASMKMFGRVLHRIVAASALGAAVVGMSAVAGADSGVGVVVVKEHGVGTSAQAQPFLDQLVNVAAQQNGWGSAHGKFHTTRSAAESFLQSDKPHYGILSLGAFLAWREPQKLTVIGQVDVSQGGGQQYHLISKTASSLAECKGKKVASDHADDSKFIDKVVSGGAFKLSDFTIVETKRPIQTIKSVVKDDAVCALIDDAQFSEMSKVDGGAGLKSVWKSAKLPPMVVVAFPSAPAAERDSFKPNLPKLCTDAGKTACGEVGILAFKTASDADYSAVVSAYSK